MTMLFERWRQIARERGNALAVRDLAQARDWTFNALLAAAEAADPPSAPIVCPQGHSVEFIIEVLRGWRTGGVVCPLEPHQTMPAVATPPAGIIHLKSTSATTGQVRLVAFTAEQLAADVDNIVATMGLRADWPNLGIISLAHSYGFSNLVLPLLLHGIPLVLAPSALPESVRQAARSAANLVLPAVPALWQTWHLAGAVPGNIRVAISAGAPLPLALEQTVFAATGLKIHNFLGASECGGIAYDAASEPRDKDGFVGTPMYRTGLSVNAEGCLEVRGPAVGETYWPESGPVLRDGCLRTTDLAEINGNRVYVRGRSGDQINIAGRKVSPEAIETALKQHAAVRECLVFGVACAEAGRVETIVACLAINSPVTPQVLKQFLLERLPAWQVPRDWWFVPSLAPDLRGKLSRAQWREKYRQQSAK